MHALRKLSSSISDLLNIQNKQLSHSVHDLHEEKHYPLHHAAKIGNSILVEKFLKNGYYKVDMEDSKGRTPLHYAVQTPSEDVTRVLLRYRANVDANDYTETAPAHFAVQMDQIGQVLLLAEYGTDFCSRDKYGKSPFDLACEYGHLEIIEHLIPFGVLAKILDDITSSSCSNISPLHLAARHGHVEICALLINSGFPLNHANSHGSALHEAVKNGRIPVARLLLHLGIDHRIVDSFGCTAGGLAEKGVDRNPISAREIISLMRGYPRRLYGTAIRNYQADESTGYLSLKIGNQIWITDQTSCEKKGLWKGIVFSERGTSRAGYFPANFVELTEERYLSSDSLNHPQPPPTSMSSKNKNKLRLGNDPKSTAPSSSSSAANPSSSSSSILKTPKTPRKLKAVPMPTVPDMPLLPGLGLHQTHHPTTTLSTHTKSTSNMNNGQQCPMETASNASGSSGSASSSKHSMSGLSIGLGMPLSMASTNPYYLPRRPSALNLPPTTALAGMPMPPNCPTSPTPSRTDSCLEGSASFTDEDFSTTDINPPIIMTSTPTTSHNFPITSTLITRNAISKKSSDRNSTSSGCSQASSGFESATTNKVCLATTSSNNHSSMMSQLATSNSSSSCGSSNLVVSSNPHNSSMSSGVSSLTDSPSSRSTGGMSTGTASSSSSPYYYCNNSGEGAYDNYGTVGGQRKFCVRELMAKGVAETEILAEWLNKLGFSQYLSLFLAQGYDLVSISRITPEDLTALGISQPEHRKQLMKDIHEWNITDHFPSYIPPNNGIRDFLMVLGLQIYIETFENQGVRTIKDLEEQTWEDFEEMGVKKLGHMKRLNLALKKLKSNRVNRQKSNPNLASPDYTYIQELPQPPMSARSTSSMSQVPLTFQNGYESGQSSAYSTLSRASRMSMATMPDMNKKRPIVPVLPSSRPIETSFETDYPVKTCYATQKIPEYSEIRKPVKLNLVTSKQILSEYNDLYEDQLENGDLCHQKQTERVEYNEDFPPPPAPLSCDTSFRILYNMQSLPEEDVGLPESIPFANDNYDTIRSRGFRSQPSTPRHSINFLSQAPKINPYTPAENRPDVLGDIGSMLKDLTDELDSMLISTSSNPGSTSARH